MSYLFIAEKPSLARAIADAIGSPKASNGYIHCAGGHAVTWCFGHLLEVVNNKDDKWKDRQLPLLPDEWIKQPKDAASAKQIKIIKELAGKFDAVVNAGDPDREGQYLVDEVLEYIKYKGKVLRIWVQALDIESIQKALKKLEDNSKYKPLSHAAAARAHADWLVGVNLTTLYTLMSGKLMSIGRVQTPTLKLIADRENAIKNFRPKDFYVLTNSINNSIESTLITKELPKGIDEESRLVDKQLAVEIADATSSKPGRVVSVKKEKKTEYPPMPFMLSSLQKHMSEHFGYTAQQTLSTLQSLYEKRLVTYPRTDCPYLPEEQFTDAPVILKNIINILKFDAKPIPTIKHKAWDSKKLTAHHGIIPTKDISNAGNLTSIEQTLYNVIMKSYFCLFFEPYQYIQTTVVFNIAGYLFQSVVKNPVNFGFMVCMQDKLPVSIAINFNEGDAVKSSQTQIMPKKTTPPPYFTDGSIIEAMTHIHKYIEDEEAKKILKETDGIGTEATRAAILENLVKKGFIKRQGKNLITANQAFVNAFLNNVPDMVKSPVLTAVWEGKLSDIVENKLSIEQFEAEQRAFVSKIVDAMKANPPKLPEYNIKQTKQTKQTNYKQTVNYNKQTNKRNTYKQTKTSRPQPQPTSIPCPNCGSALVVATTKNGKPYYRCPSCKSAYWQSPDGSIGKKWDIKITV